jgi:hypothetical protein
MNSKPMVKINKNPLRPKNWISRPNYGPHNIDVLSILFGGLLGDVHGEKRKTKQNQDNARFIFKQSNIHVEYLMWLHKFFSLRNYCSIEKPNIQKAGISKNNKICYQFRINIFTFRNLNWLYDAFYEKKIKRIPSNKYLKLFLTPQALSIWFMDDGSYAKTGVIFNTNSFLLKDLKRLQNFLLKKYKLKTTLRNTKLLSKNQNHLQYKLYLLKESLPIFIELVKNFLIPSMLYKLNMHADNN